MDLKKMVLKYQPFDKQEEKNKEEILKYIDTFDDVLTRNNEIAHFTSSGFVVNKSRNKVLVVYHKVYNSWTWVGGHADGESDLLKVALREVKEETGLENVTLVSENPLLISISITQKHIKNGKLVPTHKHLSVAYLFEADENKKLFHQEEENSDAKWIPFNEIIDKITEPYMKIFFKKAIKKISKYNL